jgi:MFS family permease
MASQSTAVAQPAVRASTFAALRLRDFRLLLFGSTLSNAAQWIQQVTLGWLVYELTGSGTALGTISLARSVASLSLAPVAGVTIDRVGRRRLMLATKAWLFVASLVLGLFLIFGRVEVWYLFVFAFLAGAGQAFDMPLRQTATFDLVPRALAPNAVALVQTGWSLMRSLGPALGGFLILWFGPGGNFLVQAGAYALIAVSIIWIRFPPRASDGKPRAGAFRHLGESIRFVAQQRATRTFVLMGWVLPLFIIPTFSALPPIYAKDVFAGGPDTLGYLMSAVGVGGIAGGIFTASLGQFERRGLVQLAALLGTSLALIGFALSPSLWVALLLLAVAGAFEMVYLTTNQTLLQLSIPDGMRGRVTSIVSLNAALSPLGAFFAGGGADLVGPRAITIILSAIAAGIAIAVYATSPTVRDYRLSQAMDGSTTGGLAA